jgi:hypothetical protein
MGGGVTTSFLPGTTLGITELDLGNGRSLFDTPGLIVPSQLTNRLIMEELAAVLPQKRVEHVTYRINPGSCVHLGGMACVELVEEPDAKAFFITIFVSNEVSVHVGKIAKAQEFREKHLGKMLSPPFSLERLEESAAANAQSWGAPSSALQGLLRKLGAGLDDLLPSISASHSKLKVILSGLKTDDEGRQLVALNELCELLSIGARRPAPHERIGGDCARKALPPFCTRILTATGR